MPETSSQPWAGLLRDRFTTAVTHAPLDPAEVRANLIGVRTPLLLLSAVHIAGDTSLLDRYQDRVGSVGVASSMPMTFQQDPELAGRVEDPAAREELVELLVTELSRADHPGYTSFVDDPDTFHRMSRMVVGSAARRDHAEMNMEQCGFRPDRFVVTPTTAPPPTLNLAIIGGGMTGLDAAVKAKDRGIGFELFEKEDGLGGLWWTQRYPGVAVDTPSTFYSLSWETTPDWSRQFPLGSEYRAYLNSIVDKYELHDHLNTGSEITKLRWLDNEQAWELTVRSRADGSVRTVRAAAVLAATGHLCRPKYPNLPGMHDFTGESVHTGLWRDLDLTGKRVAVVGAGAAGVQVVASVASEVEQLHVFQRQPHFITRNSIGTGEIDDRERWARRHLPYYTQWSRLLVFAVANDMCWKMNKVDEDWWAEHPLSVSAESEFLRQQGLAYINECFGEGSELARTLTPQFMYGGKRPVRDPGTFGPGGYYWTLAQPHVEVVTEPLARVVADGIVTADGRTVELDVIVWATGMTQDFLGTIEVVGRKGRMLSEEWANEDVRTYLGGTVPGFPNLFVQDGPNTGAALGGTGHNFMSETINHYVMECLQYLAEHDATSMEVTEEAYNKHNELIDGLMENLLWARETSAHTYYRNASGRVYFPNSIEVGEFWRLNQEPDASAYVLRERSA